MSSLTLLEAEIPPPLYVTGKNKMDVFLALMVAVTAFMYGFGGSDGGYNGGIFKQDVGIG